MKYSFSTLVHQLYLFLGVCEIPENETPFEIYLFKINFITSILCVEVLLWNVEAQELKPLLL